MADTINLITYIFLFVSLNFEIFLLITYFENRQNIEDDRIFATKKLAKYPGVTVIVPCWNEETTVSKTVYSLLELNYPKDKLKIMLVDDGSTDNTWGAIQAFENHSQIEIYKKENGGKHTALNFGLSKLQTELVGCLDADSFVHKDSLRNIVNHFEDKETMAVAPSIKLWQPKGPLQLLQKVEYGFGIFTRKMFHYMGAVYITPGPLSIFRKEVFEKLGGYKNAHKTEDIEIALRMQKNGYKIVHAHNAFVYTVPPKTLKTLLKQRVRWSHGFIKNASDYRDIFFNRKYGNLGVFILPMAAFSIISVLTISTISMINIISKLISQLVKFQTIGFNFNFSNIGFDWFYINTELIAFIGLISAIGTITMILISKKMSEGKWDLGLDLIYFMVLYIFIAPLWLAKAGFNAVFRVKASWR